jgi:hypothetical protein
MDEAMQKKTREPQWEPHGEPAGAATLDESELLRGYRLMGQWAKELVLRICRRYGAARERD